MRNVAFPEVSELPGRFFLAHLQETTATTTYNHFTLAAVQAAPVYFDTVVFAPLKRLANALQVC